MFSFLTFFALMSIPSSFVQELAPPPGSAEGNSRVEISAQLVRDHRIWPRPERRSQTDLVVIDDQLHLAFLDRWAPYSDENCLRILTSKDGTSWKSNTLRQTEQDRYLVRQFLSMRPLRLESPKLEVRGKKLIIQTTDDGFEQPGKRVVAWSTESGTHWKYDGPVSRSYDGEHYAASWKNESRPGETFWKDGTGFQHSYGTGCGTSSTIKIAETTDGQKFNTLYEKTFSNHPSPKTASLFFEDKHAICLMGTFGYAANGKNGRSFYQRGRLGRAKPPFKNWHWQQLDTAIYSPHLIQVKGIGLLVVAEIKTLDGPERTSLLRVDSKNGRLEELLNLGNLRQIQIGPPPKHNPLGEEHMDLGVAFHANHLWVSYSAKDGVYLKKIVLQSR